MLVEEVEPVMSSVTVAEIYAGKSAQNEGRQRSLLDKYILGVDVVFPTLKTAKLVGKLRYEYKMSLGDAFVAAFALEMKLPLASLDKRAFGKIKGLKIYEFKS